MTTSTRGESITTTTLVQTTTTTSSTKNVCLVGAHSFIFILDRWLHGLEKRKSLLGEYNGCWYGGPYSRVDLHEHTTVERTTAIVSTTTHKNVACGNSHFWFRSQQVACGLSLFLVILWMSFCSCCCWLTISWSSSSWEHSHRRTIRPSNWQFVRLGFRVGRLLVPIDCWFVALEDSWQPWRPIDPHHPRDDLRRPRLSLSWWCRVMRGRLRYTTAPVVDDDSTGTNPGRRRHCRSRGLLPGHDENDDDGGESSWWRMGGLVVGTVMGTTSEMKRPSSGSSSKVPSHKRSPATRSGIHDGLDPVQRGDLPVVPYGSWSTKE